MSEDLTPEIVETLENLPPKYREVLVLRHLEQLSSKETAAVLDVSDGTVKSRHFRAISQLHQQLGPKPRT